MSRFRIGRLVGDPASTRPDLLAEPVRARLQGLSLLDEVGVVEIDPAVSDTAATQREFGLDATDLANCVAVGGRREGDERLAACVVLASTRADVNRVVRRLLDVRKASFLAQERAVALTAMDYGAITPVGLPVEWPVLVDLAVVHRPLVVIGSGVRRSKILAPGPLLGQLPGASVVEGLGVPVVAA